MKVLVVCATELEWKPIGLKLLSNEFAHNSEGIYEKGQLEVATLITGVGSVATATKTTRLYTQLTPDLSINAGIAGAFSREIEIGSVVNIITEQFGDMGVEEKDGSFMDLFEVGLMSKDRYPFTDGKLFNPNQASDFLPAVRGLTVNKVHGHWPSIKETLQKYDVDVESMEGAAFYYASMEFNIPFLEIRSISNYVEERNRDHWDISGALESLSRTISDMLDTLTE